LSFLFEGGIMRPERVNGIISPSNALYTKCIAYKKYKQILILVLQSFQRECEDKDMAAMLVP
jgi:hypothetical protein